ncbi:MAG: hypothetical protein HYY29_05735 [Chloroflexi bacterium]|nr:hypothetical protein [Chloroflexota bacterium]
MEKDLERLRQQPLFPARRTKPLPGGYMGKILRVDLTSRQIKEENLPDPEVLRKYPGGQALAQLILVHETPEGTAPFSPENRVVFMTGPLTGTGKTPGGTAYTATALSNITSFGDRGEGTVASGSGMGYWAAFLKFAGYDGIVVSGASKTPVYLWVHDGKAELRDASGAWGKDTHETIEWVQQDLAQPEAKVACIGPAGENLVRASMVMSDHNHSASHGAGVILGSKKLKAIAVYGTKRVPVKNAAKLEEAGNRWRGKIPAYEYPKSRWGTGLGVALKTLVNHNFQSTILADAAAGFEKQEYTPRPCFECNRQCPYDVRLTTGSHAGALIRLNAGSEHMEGAAFTFGITGPDVYYLADLSNRLGIEASHFGCAAGLAFEAFQKGLIGLKNTDGLELKWGDTGVVAQIMHKTARREGWLGDAIADGVVATAKTIGGDARKFAANIKSGAPAMHDWRPFTGIMLGQMISSGGVKSQFSAWEYRDAAPELGFPGMTDRSSPAGKGREVYVHGSNKYFCGACGICWFAQPIGTAGMLQDQLDALAAVTGWQDFGKEEAVMVGERTWQLEHILHMRYGWTPEEDLTNIGPRMLEPIPDGPFKGFTVAKFLPDLVYDFYRECGWEVPSGRPKVDTLKRLGMEEFSFAAVA